MKFTRICLGVSLAFCLTGVSLADDLYGGVGRGSPVNPGGLLSISQVNGSGMLIGNSVGPLGLTGIDFNGSGQLFGSTIAGGPSTSTLVQINPLTGAVINNIGAITNASGPISIGDLAFQPGTGVLFGIRSNADAGGGGGQLYTINTSTGAATFIGNAASAAGGGIAFAPNGTLYQTAFSGPGGFLSLNVLNPADASRISTLAISTFYDGLAVRSDGTIFAAQGGEGATMDGIFTIDPLTGAATLIGNTGVGNSSDLAFFATAVPEPSTIALLSVGFAGVLGYRWQRSRKQRCRKRKT
jgi:hypothetical protein